MEHIGMQMIVWVLRYPGAAILHLLTLQKHSIDHFLTKRKVLSAVVGAMAVIVVTYILL